MWKRSGLVRVTHGQLCRCGQTRSPKLVPRTLQRPAITRRIGHWACMIKKLPNSPSLSIWIRFRTRGVGTVGFRQGTEGIQYTRRTLVPSLRTTVSNVMTGGKQPQRVQAGVPVTLMPKGGSWMWQIQWCYVIDLASPELIIVSTVQASVQ